jgi:hypothetical protein
MLFIGLSHLIAALGVGAAALFATGIHWIWRICLGLATPAFCFIAWCAWRLARICRQAAILSDSDVDEVWLVDWLADAAWNLQSLLGYGTSDVKFIRWYHIGSVLGSGIILGWYWFPWHAVGLAGIVVRVLVLVLVAALLFAGAASTFAERPAVTLINLCRESGRFKIKLGRARDAHLRKIPSDIWDEADSQYSFTAAAREQSAAKAEMKQRTARVLAEWHAAEAEAKRRAVKVEAARLRAAAETGATPPAPVGAPTPAPAGPAPEHAIFRPLEAITWPDACVGCMAATPGLTLTLNVYEATRLAAGARAGRFAGGAVIPVLGHVVGALLGGAAGVMGGAVANEVRGYELPVCPACLASLRKEEIESLETPTREWTPTKLVTRTIQKGCVILHFACRPYMEAFWAANAGLVYGTVAECRAGKRG